MNYEEIIEVIKEAGQIILHAHEQEMVVFDKQGDANFVTRYDKEVQAYLI